MKNYYYYRDNFDAVCQEIQNATPIQSHKIVNDILNAVEKVSNGASKNLELRYRWFVYRNNLLDKLFEGATLKRTGKTLAAHINDLAKKIR